MICNFHEVLNFNWLSLKLNMLMCDYLIIILSAIYYLELHNAIHTNLDFYQMKMLMFYNVQTTIWP